MISVQIFTEKSLMESDKGMNRVTFYGKHSLLRLNLGNNVLKQYNILV